MVSYGFPIVFLGVIVASRKLIGLPSFRVPTGSLMDTDFYTRELFVVCPANYVYQISDSECDDQRNVLFRARACQTCRSTSCQPQYVGSQRAMAVWNDAAVFPIPMVTLNVLEVLAIVSKNINNDENPPRVWPTTKSIQIPTNPLHIEDYIRLILKNTSFIIITVYYMYNWIWAAYSRIIRIHPGMWGWIS